MAQFVHFSAPPNGPLERGGSGTASLEAASHNLPAPRAPEQGSFPIAPLYPVRVRLRDGTEISIRPITPGDAEREQAFVRALSAESRFYRFMSTMRELSPEMLQRFTHPDPRRDVALVALTGQGEQLRQIGVARCAGDEACQQAEFAVVVADELQNRGVGRRLLCELIRAARAIGLRELWGDILVTNRRMLSLMTALGFELRSAPSDPVLVRARLSLHDNDQLPT